MADGRVSKGVVLAAGDGSRLGDLTATYPKVLLPVRGKPLIWHPIEALVAAGITEIAVVVGYCATHVKATLGDGSRFGARLAYITNPDYLGGNAISVGKAKPWAEGKPFVLCMGDHIMELGFVCRLLDKSPVAETLCVDFAPAGHHQLAEATKVLVDSAGCIRHIGKELASWDGLDTGVFLLTGRFLDAVEQLIPELGIHIEISDVIRFLVGTGCRFATCDVTGSFWTDVDTEEDLGFATA
ncbi:MAG TPA: NTP transferase domain-containing protein [Dehalococcoidia bacterium]|nr:NTP transferase domain-containing protein [Dehalococcoidia bacterium]